MNILTEILRHRWGFQGVLVSDYFGIADLNNLHHVVANNDEAAKLALESGVAVELPPADAFQSLAAQVQKGTVAEADIDRAVAHLLREKFLTGLFDAPYVDPAN